jgi:hypothetical protein
VTTFIIGVIVPLVISAAANELSDVSPWLARKIIRQAARTWALGDLGLAQAYEEEWSAVVDDCPGKLYKLGLALRFAVFATARAEYRRVRRFIRQLGNRRAAKITKELAPIVGGLVALTTTTWLTRDSLPVALWGLAGAVALFGLVLLTSLIASRVRSGGLAKALRRRVAGRLRPMPGR